MNVPSADISHLERAADYLRVHQLDTGALPGDYSGPMFLLPMYVGTLYATGEMPDEAQQADMVKYIRGAQNPDGGFGLGEENPSCVFTSVLNYVTMRLLGVERHDEDLQRCRKWFMDRGGALASASWGKFFLAIMNLYDYRGLHPVPPELWLLPYEAPLHPGRMWCHARMVYLPMSWMYGARAQVPLDGLLSAIREEIHPIAYSRIDWKAARDTVAPEDAYTPLSMPMKVANKALHAYERSPLKPMRPKALEECLRQIRYEDEITNYVCIGPVNKPYNTLVWHFAEPGGERVRKHLERMPDYLWSDRRGTRVNGYNNSQLWDTAFAIQALKAAKDKRGLQVDDLIEKAHDYLDHSQIPEDPPDAEAHYRCPSKGGWPFSNLEHGWPITDCTSEGLKCALLLQDEVKNPIDLERLKPAVDLLLYWQNENGGWASYERTRGPAWLEKFNPSDIFHEIMIDYPYTECSSAVLQGLAAWREVSPGDPRVDKAIERGKDFILSKQEADGSWFGSWGVCYTYGTWFGVWGLLAAGMDPSAPQIQKAADFVESIQLADGGWGETIDSCAQKRSIPTDEGQAVMTSWALLTLVKAGRKDSEAVKRGVTFLRERQLDNGTWPEEHIAGVFNKTCSITYDNYRRVFPVWALALAE